MLRNSIISLHKFRAQPTNLDIKVTKFS